MLWDTFKVLVLSVLTILLFHMLLQLVQIRIIGHASPIRIGLSEKLDIAGAASDPKGGLFTEGFGLSLAVSPDRSAGTSGSRRPQPCAATMAGLVPAPFSAVCATSDSSTTGATAGTTESSSAHAVPLADLESELKAWMQRESSNWTEPAAGGDSAASAATSALPDAAASGTENAQATSIEAVFAAQQVDMQAIAPGAMASQLGPNTTAAKGTASTSAFAPAMNGSSTNPSAEVPPNGTVIAFDSSGDCFATV